MNMFSQHPSEKGEGSQQKASMEHSFPHRPKVNNIYRAPALRNQFEDAPEKKSLNLSELDYND